MVQLYEHNKTTYENLISLYANHDRVACVQPTGTGKSFIMLKLIEDNLDKKFFIASPSLYIFEQLKTHAEDNSVDISNCVFSTYQKLIYMSHEYIESIEADYIILDEFHRLGSAEWGGTGVETLLNSHPNCKVLGTSATPIRYLDNMRNMAEEIFDSCYAVNMNLAEAIRRKILPLPVYVTAWYSFSGEIARLEEKIATVDNPYLRNKLYNKIQKAKSKVIDTDCGLESILHKHITNPNGKYIVFCPNIASLESAKNNCRHWFEKVNKKINVYSVYTTGDNVKQQFEAFKNDTSDCLKLLLCIDMLNEGIHVKDVDGVIMLRSTTSANVFYQQLGRALTCSNRNPVIFDLVNNYETGNTADEYASVMELGRHYKHDDSELDITFEIYDYVRDIRELLDDISNTFEMSWESTFQVLCEFINQNKRFPYQKEKYNGLSLGCWCDSQKMMYRNGRLSEVRINALEEIGFPWDTLEEAWNIKFSMLKAFKERTGRFPVRKDSLEDESIHQLYTWCSSQRQFYKTGRMLHDRILKFQEIGFELSVLSDAERWDEKYTQLVEICEMLNHFPSGNKVENKELMSWMIIQRKLIKDGTLSEDRMQKLMAIDFICDTDEYRWNRKFKILQQFINENKRNPKTNERYGDFCIGQWYYKQITDLGNGILSPEHEEKIKALGIIPTTFTDEKWQKNYELLKEFISVKGRLPYTKEKYKGVILYSWINHQKRFLLNDKYEKKRIDLLKELGVDLLNFSSNKFDTDIPGNWIEKYEEYKDFLAEHHRKPNRSADEGKMYRWRRRQIIAINENRLNQAQLELLKQIDFE